MSVFFSFTCFWQSWAAQKQVGFWNFTSGSVWKWRLKWRNSGSPIELSVALGTLIDPRWYASAWKKRKRCIRYVLRERSNAHSVQKYKMASIMLCQAIKRAQSLHLLVYSLTLVFRSRLWYSAPIIKHADTSCPLLKWDKVNQFPL